MVAGNELDHLELVPLHEQEELPAKGKPFQDAGRAPQAEPTYQGPNRRKAERRTGMERREEFRFEPGKEDRRKGKDRRKHSRLDDTFVR